MVAGGGNTDLSLREYEDVCILCLDIALEPLGVWQISRGGAYRACSGTDLLIRGGPAANIPCRNTPRAGRALGK